MTLPIEIVFWQFALGMMMIIWRYDVLRTVVAGLFTCTFRLSWCLLFFTWNAVSCLVWCIMCCGCCNRCSLGSVFTQAQSCVERLFDALNSGLVSFFCECQCKFVMVDKVTKFFTDTKTLYDEKKSEFSKSVFYVAVRPQWYWLHLAAQVGFLFREFMVVSINNGWYVECAIAYLCMAAVVFFTAQQVWKYSKVRNLTPDAVTAIDQVLDMLLLPINYGFLCALCVRSLKMFPNEPRNTAMVIAVVDSADIWESWALWSVLQLFIRVVDLSAKNQVAPDPSVLPDVHAELAARDQSFHNLEDSDSAQASTTLSGMAPSMMLHPIPSGAPLGEDKLRISEVEDTPCPSLASEFETPQVVEPPTTRRSPAIQGNDGTPRGAAPEVPSSRFFQRPAAVPTPDAKVEPAARHASNASNEGVAVAYESDTAAILPRHDSVTGNPFPEEEDADLQQDIDANTPLHAFTKGTRSLSSHMAGIAGIWQVENLGNKYLDVVTSFKLLSTYGVQCWVYLLIVTSLAELAVKGILSPRFPTLCFSLLSKCTTCDQYYDDEISPSVYVVIYILCSAAIVFVVVFERTFKDYLHRIEPYWKFWGVKVVVSVTFMQKIGINHCCGFDEAQVYLYHCLLICMELPVLCAVHTYLSYPFNADWMFLLIAGDSPRKRIDPALVSPTEDPLGIPGRRVLRPHQSGSLREEVGMSADARDRAEAALIRLPSRSPPPGGLRSKDKKSSRSKEGPTAVGAASQASSTSSRNTSRASSPGTVRRPWAQASIPEPLLPPPALIEPSHTNPFEEDLADTAEEAQCSAGDALEEPQTHQAPELLPQEGEVRMRDEASLESAQEGQPNPLPDADGGVGEMVKSESFREDKTDAQNFDCFWVFAPEQEEEEGDEELDEEARARRAALKQESLPTFVLLSIFWCVVGISFVARILPYNSESADDGSSKLQVTSSTCDIDPVTYVNKMSNGSVKLPDSYHANFRLNLCQKVTLQCAQGFTAHDSRSPTLACQATASDFTITGSCDTTRCGAPIAIPNADPQDTGQACCGPGDMVSYNCVDGFVGDAKAQCDMNGLWQIISNNCQIVGCGSLASNVRSLVNSGMISTQEPLPETSYDGQVVNFNCSIGMRGNPQAICFNQTWHLTESGNNQGGDEPCAKFVTAHGCKCKQKWTHCSGHLFSHCFEYYGCARTPDKDYSWCSVEKDNEGSLCEGLLQKSDFWGQRRDWDYCVDDNYGIVWKPQPSPTNRTYEKGFDTLSPKIIFAVACLLSFCLVYFLPSWIFAALVYFIPHAPLGRKIMWTICTRTPRGIRRLARICCYKLDVRFNKIRQDMNERSQEIQARMNERWRSFTQWAEGDDGTGRQSMASENVSGICLHLSAAWEQAQHHFQSCMALVLTKSSSNSGSYDGMAGARDPASGKEPIMNGHLAAPLLSEE